MQHKNFKQQNNKGVTRASDPVLLQKTRPKNDPPTVAWVPTNRSYNGGGEQLFMKSSLLYDHDKNRKAQT